MNMNESAQGLKLDKKTLLTITAVLVGIVVFAGALTQLVPRGEYQMDTAGNIVPDSYTRLPGAKLPIWKIIASPVLIFTEGAATTGVAIILFIILIGGTFLILDKSGVLKYILTAVVSKFKARKYMLLSLVVFIFMALAAVIGIMEESLTLVPLAVAISLALGWDSLVGIACPWWRSRSATAPRCSTRLTWSSCRSWRGCRFFRGSGTA
jgi:uncharacterized ion transporter superfamily protein YfcC